MSAAAPPQLHTPQRTFLGHPIGLYVLFFTEMWERFSFYGMRALLILYMTSYFRMAQKDASTIYKVYTSFVYVTPILGGYLADRYLGNRWAVIIGAVLMAFGHFMMAFPTTDIFYGALVLLILGNGFFKPNMSIQVGRLYSVNDSRRDGAYTIFYMGINLGAFFAPLVCGWLRDNTVGEFHSGFSMAGIGMVLGLFIYLLGQPFIRELNPDGSAVASNTHNSEKTKQIGPNADQENGPSETDAPSEAEVERVPSVIGKASVLLPILLVVVGTCLVVAGPTVWWLGILSLWNAIMLPIGGSCLLLIAWIAAQVHGGLRDRVLAILALGIFVIFFWGAFEQAGNVQNLWADQSTNRFLTKPMEEPKLFPPAAEKGKEEKKQEVEPKEGMSFATFFNQFRLKQRSDAGQSWGDWFWGNLNPVPTTWFLAINAGAIFVLAPIFAWLWVSLDRWGFKLSIPLKMVIGLVMMAASMVLMAGAANQENRLTTVPWSGTTFPDGVQLNETNQQLGLKDDKGRFEPFHAGRLVFDSKEGKLNIMGVLPDTEAFRIIGATAPEQFDRQIKVLQIASAWIGSSRADGTKKLDELKKKTEEKLSKAKPEERNKVQAELDWLNKLVIGSENKDGTDTIPSVGLALQSPPAGFDMRYSEIPKSAVEYLAAGHILVVRRNMAEKEVKGLEVAAADPKFRDTIESLFKSSSQWRVSPLWLFWSYILATVGELVISPVGLSMVSKLSPAKFATMLMGVWLFTNSFGNFAAGYLGELWGTIPPTQFFLYVAGGVFAASLVLLALVHWVVRTMHGVR